MTFAWDDLRFVLAIGRSGNLAAAAAALSVNHSTMFRRLNALEATIGSKLFERLASGYRPTDAGQRLIEAAVRMEAEALALDRDLTGRDARLGGQLRVTCSETLGFKVLTPLIRAFRDKHPGIMVDLSVDNRQVDMARREADVAIRATRPAEGDLFGRKIADVRWGFFAAPDYVKRRGMPKSLSDIGGHDLIGWTETAPRTKAGASLSRHVPHATIGFRANGFVGQYIAARAGLGIALLPVYLAAGDKEVVPILGRLSDLVTEMWIVTHRSLKDTARVRSFMDDVGDGVKREIARVGR
jgi:DNA-binding transcriptional LysR family regulator